jgi:trans-aconitate methyltransferase
MIKHKEFWKEHGLENIKPKRTGHNWESFNASKVVERLCGNGSVNDVGCGTGRMSQSFESRDYIGHDLNPAAIAIADKEYPGWVFATVEEYASIIPADILLLHSAALHIPDDELEALLTRMHSRIVIGEAMRNWLPTRKRDPKAGLATHYARCAEDYFALAGRQGFACKHKELHCDTFGKKDFTYLVFEK